MFKRRNLESGIKYYSTNHRADPVSFREALLKGLAPDGGLYMPMTLPRLSREELDSLSGLSYPGLAAFITGMLIGSEIEKSVLESICNDVYSFPVPLENVMGRRYIMRLDQGPTASFKDFAALLMGRLMHHYLSLENRQITILTATSGDTGSAVANAFFGLDNINVVILFPLNEISDIQRKQMTTLGRNIRIIGIDGKFDDCQHLVKKAFMDPGLERFNLASANSINTGRLLPQSVYYFHAWSQLASNTGDQIIFSVPSGNFGNVTGGLFAKRMGLPVKRFIIATNENDEFPRYLETKTYIPLSPSRNSPSSAMNVGHPSNLARIISLYGGIMNEKGKILKEPDYDRILDDICSVSISDADTLLTIERFFRDHGLVLEPHGAVAWKALEKYFESARGCDDRNLLTVSLETAHPAKFGKEVADIIDHDPELPPSLMKVKDSREEFISLENDYYTFKKHIKQNY